MREWKQRELTFRTHGGRRRGAGRKPAAIRPEVPHRRRPEHHKHHPVHVTLRVARGLPSLRRDLLFARIRSAFARTARTWFRIVHYSIQADHVHMLVEANDKVSLSRGLTGALVRLARAVNRVLGRRGSIWSSRYHARALKTPREVRNAIVYVLMNAKKHLLDALEIDPCSSAWCFRGWKTPPSTGPLPADQAIRLPETWLLRTGWKRHGLIGLEERPRSAVEQR